MPSPLFNFLFFAALFVPAAMYIGGVIILMLSLVVKHYRLTHAPVQPSRRWRTDLRSPCRETGSPWTATKRARASRIS